MDLYQTNFKHFQAPNTHRSIVLKGDLFAPTDRSIMSIRYIIPKEM